MCTTCLRSPAAFVPAQCVMLRHRPPPPSSEALPHPCRYSSLLRFHRSSESNPCTNFGLLGAKNLCALFRTVAKLEDIQRFVGHRPLPASAASRVVEAHTGSGTGAAFHHQSAGTAGTTRAIGVGATARPSALHHSQGRARRVRHLDPRVVHGRKKVCRLQPRASHTRGVLTHVRVFRISRRMSFGRSQAQQMIAAAAAVVTRGPDVSSLTDDINAKAAFKYNPLLEEQVSVPIVDQLRLAIDRHRLRVHLGCVIQRRHRDGCAACWASCWTRAEPSSAPSRTACCSASTRSPLIFLGSCSWAHHGRLCRLINKLKPGTIPQIHTSSIAYKQMENIAAYLKVCPTQAMCLLLVSMKILSPNMLSLWFCRPACSWACRHTIASTRWTSTRRRISTWYAFLPYIRVICYESSHCRIASLDSWPDHHFFDPFAGHQQHPRAGQARQGPGHRRRRRTCDRGQQTVCAIFARAHSARA